MGRVEGTCPGVPLLICAQHVRSGGSRANGPESGRSRVTSVLRTDVGAASSCLLLALSVGSACGSEFRFWRLSRHAAIID